MLQSQKLNLKLSETRQKLNELAGIDELTDEQRSELDKLQGEYPDLEKRYRAAVVAEGDEAEQAAKDDPGMDAETRERIELRSKAKLTDFFRSALTGRALTGAAAELQQAAGVDGIPLELWDVPKPETRAISAAPATVGVNLDTLRPAVFAPSIADKLGIAMPEVGSGTYATGTITTSTEADAVAKEADVPERAAVFNVETTTPHRVGASLNLAIEDIASVGASNFEATLRENVSLVLSDELDDQAINGDGANDDLTGIFARLTDPAAPGAEVAGFSTFLEAFASGIDGLWASMMKEVTIVAGVETYRLSASVYPAMGGSPFATFADYAGKLLGGWFTNKRMPAAASNIQQAILYRHGRQMLDGMDGKAMRTAVCPTWGYVSIDDIYTGARKGTRRFVVSVLVGDVILVQPDAYSQVSFRVAAGGG